MGKQASSMMGGHSCTVFHHSKMSCLSLAMSVLVAISIFDHKVVCNPLQCQTSIPYTKKGCYNYDPSLYSENNHLLNMRDELGDNDFQDVLKRLVCSCSKLASAANYKYFALHTYAECSGLTATVDSIIDDGPTGQCQSSLLEGGCNPTGNLICTGTPGKSVLVYKIDDNDESAAGVDGDYGEWGQWTACSESCGAGEKRRERQCNNPSPSGSGADCTAKGDASETAACNMKPCPVDGQFTNWSEFGTCTKTCDGGSQERSRTCTNPPPSNGGRDCEGLVTDGKLCNVQKCGGVDGGWSDWEEFGECTKTCGSGVMERKRFCTNPASSSQGKECVGLSLETKTCNSIACPVDGAWSEWDAFGECSKTCGSGEKQRQRSCTAPTPAFGGMECIGLSTETDTCSTMPCPIDGSWSEWDAFDECSKTCGSGVKQRQRSCAAPTPAFGGMECIGLSTETDTCNTLPCPIDGAWSEWAEFGECSKTCGSGVMKRPRFCTNPAPSNQGKECVGLSLETETCNSMACPVDGGWSEWDAFGECSKTCGSGVKQRQRSCAAPTPAFGGMECIGLSTQAEICSTMPCPIDGALSPWSDFGECSASCGYGSRVKTRQCTAPQFGGKDCAGSLQLSISCLLKPCPIDGGVSQWSIFSKCSASCGGGVRCRTRTCTNPFPSRDGRYCSETLSEEEECNNVPCPVNGGLGPWSSFSTCSKTCGGGTQTRQRLCNSPPPQNGGADCYGAREDRQTCCDFSCTVHGGFGPWSSFSTCSKSCDGGTQTRQRLCNSPPPQNGGAECYGAGEQTQRCGDVSCPVDSEDMQIVEIGTGDRVHLACTKGVLDIHRAKLRRRWRRNTTRKSCRDQLATVQSLCQGRSSCSFLVDKQQFLEDCLQMNELIKIKYHCDWSGK